MFAFDSNTQFSHKLQPQFSKHQKPDIYCFLSFQHFTWKPKKSVIRQLTSFEVKCLTKIKSYKYSKCLKRQYKTVSYEILLTIVI